jgi:methionyl-tRNA formyltransferase
MTSRRASAVVFANVDVGVRCLSVLLAGGIDVKLVVTHEDDPQEMVHFASVAQLALRCGLPVALPERAGDPAFVERIAGIAPDFIFSFYYRQMLPAGILSAARRGALNMHGSLLPRYRGRAPVNWVVIRGETETGATLHYMTEKPDAGDIVDQQAVPVLPEDTAYDVFTKVTVAAEIVMWRSLPGLVRGDITATPQDASAVSYFGRRRPEDGEIDWSAPAATVHDLVRGVAPPYPGAYTMLNGSKLRILRTTRAGALPAAVHAPSLFLRDGCWFAACSGGGVLRIVEMDLDGSPVSATGLERALGAARIPLPIPLASKVS